MTEGVAGSLRRVTRRRSWPSNPAAVVLIGDLPASQEDVNCHRTTRSWLEDR